MNRRLEVMEQVVTCERCELHAQCASPVPFYGSSPNRIAIVGEAPSAQEDLVGQPFIGAAGQMIRKHLVEVGIDPESDVSWLNSASCYSHGTPTKEHIEACRVNKVDQLNVIDPQYVLLLGKVSLWGQNPEVEMKRVRGRPFLVDDRLNFSTYHPSAALRNGNFERSIHDDLEVFKRLLDGDQWTKFISDKCASCGDWAIWFTENGLPWCEKHAPPDCAEWQQFLEAERVEVHKRLHPGPPEQLAIG